jgi:putative ATP-binding cassette transporter
VHRDTSFAQLKLGAVSSGTDDKPAGLDAQVCRRFWFLWSLTFTGCCGGNVGRLWWILVCATLSGLSLAKVYLIMPYILSSVGDDDMRGMAMYIGSIAAMMMIYSCIDSYIFNMVAHVVLCWRADVVQQLQSRLFAPRVWYDGVKRDKRLPDLDQRTTGDVQKMTNAMTNLLLSVTSLPKCGIFFAVCLVQCPYSVVGITAYGVFVVLFLKWVLGSIPALVFTRETKEGEFRFLLIRVKTFSESISFYKGGARELVDLSDKLNELMGAFRAWIPPYCRGMFFARLASSMLYAMTLLCIVFETQFNPDWKDKDIDDVLGTYGTATSYAVTTMLLLSAISQFSVLAGHVNRVAETFGFVEEIRLRQEQEAGSITHEGPDAHAPVDYVELADLTVCVPSTLQSTKNDNPLLRKLFSEVNLTIRRGQSTIIMGRSGSGKSTLLRVIAGLWPVTEGTVTCPRKVGRGGMLFVPQSPYLPEGSLLEQIAYPGTRAQMEAYCRQQGTTSLATCERLLRITGLLHLEQEHGLREKLPWADMLSVGEQQRLAFCRVFYHQPLFVVMDESTSAMDLASQRACMEALAELKITAISVAHRPTLVQFHTQKLELIGSPDGSSVGTYKVSRIEEQ